MNSFAIKVQVSTGSVRSLAILLALLVSTVGCGPGGAPIETPFQPPEEFSEKENQWLLQPGIPTNADNQLIGRFFRKNQNLIGSPDWTGDPRKYVCGTSKSLVRFYWFSGTDQNASWNALEFQGTRFRQLNGFGSPGVDSPKK